MPEKESKEITILLVMQDRTELSSFAKRLKGGGYRVVMAQDQDRALALARGRRSLDLALVDIDLSRPSGGIAAARAILHIRDIPLIFFLSKPDIKKTEKAKKISAHGFVLKETGDYLLFSSIESALSLFRAVREARESEERYRLLIESSRDVVYSVNKDGAVTFISRQIGRYGYRPDDMHGKHFLDFVSPEHKNMAYHHYKASIQKNDHVPIELRFLSKDGEGSWVEVSGSNIYGKSGEYLMQIGIMRDIGERKWVEEILESQRRTLQTVLDNMPAGVFMVRAPSGKPILSNKMAEEILGQGISPETTHDELNITCHAYRHGTDDLYPPEEMPVMAGLRGLSITVDDMEIRRPDGNPVLLEVRGAPVYDRDKNIIGSIVVFQDITEHQRLHEELERHRGKLEQLVEDRTMDLTAANEKLRTEIGERGKAEEQIRSLLHEKDLILKEVHHRIKNNMSTIASLISLQENICQDQHAATVLNDARNRVMSMMGIYDKLYRSGDYFNINMQHYLEDLITDIADSYNDISDRIHFVIDIDDVFVKTKLSFPLGIIANELISNALKYAFPDGQAGTIIVSLKRLDDASIEFSVSDNGIGIPESLKDDSMGGFGLFLVNSLVKQIDGSMDVENGSGTRYLIRCRL